MALDIELVDQGRGAHRVRLIGRLDTMAAPDLERRLEPLLGDPTVSVLVLELGGLEYITSAGIRSVMRARKALEGRGGHVALVGLQPPIQRVSTSSRPSRPARSSRAWTSWTPTSTRCSTGPAGAEAVNYACWLAFGEPARAPAVR